MRIVTWNCCMGLHGKLAELEGLGADVVIVQECAAPDVPRMKDVYAGASTFLWFGDEPNKGIAILSYGEYRLEALSPGAATDPKFVIPVKVKGPTSFLLLAVWAQGGDRKGSYVAKTFEVMGSYAEIIRREPTVVAGDFNSSSVWDHESSPNHSDLVERLKGLGLVSAYHWHAEQDQGGELHPTFHLQWNIMKPYHLDYVFVPATWSIEDVQVGVAEEWLKCSDHCPVSVDVVVLG